MIFCETSHDSTMKNKWQKETHEAPGDLPLSMKLLKVVSFWIILMYFDSLLYNRFFGRCTVLQLQVQWSITWHPCVWLSVILSSRLLPPALTKRHAFTGSTNSQPASRQAERKTWVMRQEWSRAVVVRSVRQKEILSCHFEGFPNKFCRQLSIMSQ